MILPQCPDTFQSDQKRSWVSWNFSEGSKTFQSVRKLFIVSGKFYRVTFSLFFFTFPRKNFPDYIQFPSSNAMLELLEDFSDSVQLNTTTSTITNQSSIIPGQQQMWLDYRLTPGRQAGDISTWRLVSSAFRGHHEGWSRPAVLTPQLQLSTTVHKWHQPRGLCGVSWKTDSCSFGGAGGWQKAEKLTLHEVGSYILQLSYLIIWNKFVNGYYLDI